MTTSTETPCKIAVLATCFNRRDTTIRGLAALRQAAEGINYHVWLVDDASTDGTKAAVQQEFPEVTIIDGTGSLYWNGGMLHAWRSALGQGADYYLLYNDDLVLKPQSLVKLLNFQNDMERLHGAKVISVGKVVDSPAGNVTYGGYIVGPGISRLRFIRVPDDGRPCDTMNANCSLIPAQAVDDVGLLSDHYRHHTGDIDYGLRARNAGYKIFQSFEAVGETPFNYAFHARQDYLSWSNAKFVLTNPKGLPVREWLHFCRQHAGWLWPVNFLSRYLKIIKIKNKKF